MSIIDKLVVVQDLDMQIRTMEQELKDIPARQEEEKTRMNKDRKALEEAGGVLKSVQAKLAELQLECSAREEKIVKLRQQQMELKTNKEFKAMDMEIEAVRRAIGRLEDKELDVMETLEAATQETALRSEDLKRTESVIQKDIVVLDERAAGISAELDKIRALREDAVTDIPADWLAAYSPIAERRGQALVKLVDGFCGGCHMKLPPSVLHDVKKKDRMVHCNFCGRMLH